MKNIELNKLATELVGDNKSPNLFFVSVGGDTMLITSDFALAYDAWAKLPRNIETSIEDRKNGVLASTAPIEDDSPILRTIDEAAYFIRLRN